MKTATSIIALRIKNWQLSTKWIKKQLMALREWSLKGPGNSIPTEDSIGKDRILSEFIDFWPWNLDWIIPEKSVSTFCNLTKQLLQLFIQSSNAVDLLDILEHLLMAQYSLFSLIEVSTYHQSNAQKWRILLKVTLQKKFTFLR